MSGFRVCLAQHSKDLSLCCTTPITCSLPFFGIFSFFSKFADFFDFGLIFSQSQWSTSRKWPMKNSLKWVSLKWVHWHFSYETIPVPAKIFTKLEFILKCASLKWVPDCTAFLSAGIATPAPAPDGQIKTQEFSYKKLKLLRVSEGPIKTRLGAV